MEILVLLAELAAIAGGVNNAVKIAEAIRQAGRTYATPEEVAKIRAALTDGHQVLEGVDFLTRTATGR